MNRERPGRMIRSGRSIVGLGSEEPVSLGRVGPEPSGTGPEGGQPEYGSKETTVTLMSAPLGAV